MAILPIIVHLIHCMSALVHDVAAWISVRSKDSQKQLARATLKFIECHSKNYMSHLHTSVNFNLQAELAFPPEQFHPVYNKQQINHQVRDLYLTNKEAQAVYYTVIKHDGHLRKHEPQASVFYISRVFSNDWSVLSQCNTRLRLLHLHSYIDFHPRETIKHAFLCFILW